MRFRFSTAFSFAACLVAALPAAAQSLGDVARAEEARRATAKKAVKSFSNADLAANEIAPPVAPPPAPAAATASPVAANASPVAADAATAPDAAAAAPKESEWRSTADDLRRQLQKAREELDKLNAVADNDSRLSSDRTAAARLAAHQIKALERIEARWLRFEKDAESLKVPREWLQPVPILSTRIPQ